MQIHINREYTEWSFSENGVPITDSHPLWSRLQEINPLKSKLFNNDELDDELVAKTSRDSIFAGVLCLEQNKTFGRHNRRLLYKCIPDADLPAFLIPYDLAIGFYKKQTNKYVLFKFAEWNSKHPIGTLHETIGDVNDVNVFCEYQLHCKHLHHSLTPFTKHANRIITAASTKSHIDQFTNIVDRRKEYIFTIDPVGATDFDDGVSVIKDGANWRVSVYIANVAIWINAYDLWSHIKRISTIYLPDKTRTMLPPILIELCSLIAGCDRYAFTIDLLYTDEGVLIGEPTFAQTVIRVSKNYTYDQRIVDAHYFQLLNLSKKMANIASSRDLITFWMIKMNTACSANMVERNIGIFRTSVASKCADKNPDTQRFIYQWNSSVGVYSLSPEEHPGMNTTYIHITSPVRRLVDLYNQNWFIYGIAPVFDIDYINRCSANVRKIQTECYMLDRLSKDDGIIERPHVGIVFNKTEYKDKFSYTVYLEDLKLVSRVICDELPEYSRHSFKIFLFYDESTAKKKVRLAIPKN